MDISVKDSIDDTTSIFDGDTFSCSVPSCVNEVSFCSALFHFLNKLFCIFCWMQFQECLAEASRECRCRLCDSTLCTSKFSCESRQEVVLSLSFCQDRYWRKYAECICGQEDYVLSCRCRRDRANDFLECGRSDRKHECSLLRSYLRSQSFRLHQLLRSQEERYV